MKHSHVKFFALFILMYFSFFLSCKKNIIAESYSKETVQSIRKWFETASTQYPLIWNTTKYYIDWVNTSKFSSTNGEKYISIPYKNLISLPNSEIVLSRQLLIKMDNDNKPISVSIIETFSDEAFLNVNKNSLANNFVNNTHINFSGAIIEWDLSYKQITSANYTNGKKTGTANINSNKKNTNSIAERMNNITTNKISTSSYAQTCDSWTDWYFVVYNNGVIIDMTFIERICDGSASPSSSDIANYAIYGNNSSGNSPAATQIKTDSSIKNCPLVNCLDSALKGTINDILASFENNNKYDVTFKLKNMGTDTLGLTSVNTTSNGVSFIININASNAMSSIYSRIYLAKTFIHEAFHAKLRQKAFELIGSDNIATWKKNIDDMTLKELMTYFYNNTTANQSWNNIGHDWIACNITTCATDLMNFVRNYYPSNYAEVGGTDLNSYIAFFYQGLENTPMYLPSLQERGWNQDSVNSILNFSGRVFTNTNCPGQTAQTVNPE